VVKHRQLARQVGAFGAITIKSYTDFDHMIFPTGSVFIFGSWVYEANDEGNLQGHLAEAQEARKELAFPTGLAEDLAKGFSGLTISESTRAPTTTRFDLISDSDSFSGSNPDSSRDKTSSFPIGLRNMTSTLGDQFGLISRPFQEVGSTPNRTR
jgi:hypothetical protein